MLYPETDKDLYLLPTPAGTFHTVSRPTTDPSRQFLRALFRQNASPLLNQETLLQLTGSTSYQDAEYILRQAQQRGWLQGVETSQSAPVGSYDEILPDLLAPLSSEGRVLLADQQGLHVGSHGFDRQFVDELSALTADLALLQERHLQLLTSNLELSTSAWGLVDAAGSSQIGFWPIYIGEQYFALVVANMPRLNQHALTRLVWALSKRYDQLPGYMNTSRQ